MRLLTREAVVVALVVVGRLVRVPTTDDRFIAVGLQYFGQSFRRLPRRLSLFRTSLRFEVYVIVRIFQFLL